MHSGVVFAVVVRFPDLPLSPVHWYGLAAFTLVCALAVTYALVVELGDRSEPRSTRSKAVAPSHGAADRATGPRRTEPLGDA